MMATPAEQDKASFVRLTGSKERLWRKLQDCYDLTRKLPDKLTQFKARVGQIHEVRQSFGDVLDKLFVLSNKHDDFQTDVVKLESAFDAMYFDILAYASEYASPPVSEPISAVSGSPSNVKKELSLRDIHLPKFDGRPENFPAFRAMFDAMVHATTYSDIEKFTILMNSLENSALKFAQTVRFSPENYLVVYNQLINRYTNKRVIVNHYLRTIFSLNALKTDNYNAMSELCETLQTNVSALKDMKLPDLSDYIFVQFALRLVDLKTKEEFENKYLSTEFPSFSNFIDFLRDKCSVAQLVGASLDIKTINRVTIGNSNIVPTVKGSKSTNFFNKRISMNAQDVTSTNITAARCPFCSQGDHFRLTKCSKFRELSPKQRHDFVKVQNFCYACLYPHPISKCRVKIRCEYCSSSRHNTLLHEREYNFSKGDLGEGNKVNDREQVNSSVARVHSCAMENTSAALLATARVLIKSFTGEWFPCRLLLDGGSQINFLTTSMATRLGLTRQRCLYEIKGVGQSTPSKLQGKVECIISSMYNRNFALTLEAVVMSHITTNLPSVTLSDQVKARFDTLELADPDFNISSPVDMLLGVQAVLDVTPNEPSILKGQPTAYLTSFGWVVLGNVPKQIALTPDMVSNTCTQLEPSLNETLRAFWEVEEISLPTPTSPEDNFCEQYYSETIQRNENGQYIVRLPLKNKEPILDNTRELARNRFLKLEKRFKRDEIFYKLYADNMRDYINQGHLIPTTSTTSYMMTHHGVTKQRLDGPNIRVVFNPAEKGAEGKSLNDMLYCGPKLHQDIAEIITRFRLKPIALTCDICQMFRSILLHPGDRQYFHVFWRFHPDEPLIEWEHTRVVFGATCSPYLAIRTLKQLVEDEGLHFPLASKALNCQTFVDDILTGAADKKEALQLKNELNNLLKRGGFQLAKWACSHPEIIDSSGETLELPLGDIPSSIKVLGIFWDTRTDHFQYKIQNMNEPPTKRGILSRVARTYDINGYLAPFTFLLKTLIQRLWLLKIDWDEPLPANIMDQWTRIKKELFLIENIKIPRCIWKSGSTSGKLIGFSDASVLGMAAVIYLRLNIGHQYFIYLVASKTRVAPIKTWTIPRLELGAACLLAKLMRSTLQSFHSFVELSEPICFVDSTTVLGWIKMPPHSLKTFVANRVIQIHENLSSVRWRYVSGKNNPADPASRGLTPKNLLECSLWWEGPTFLLENDFELGVEMKIPTDLPEVKEITEINSLLTVRFEHNLFVEVFNRVSTLPKLQRVLAYIIRFCYNWRKNKCKEPKINWLTGPLTAKEYDNALLFAIRITQSQFCTNEFNLIEKGLPCSKKLRELSPFISPTGYLMVGGRLRHSRLSYSVKHPFYIPNGSRLATLLCDYYHIYTCHGGPRLVQSLLNRRFWIPSSRRLIRSRIFRCLPCYRFKAEPVQPPMGDLPAYRLQPTRCFTHTGLDFSGPFEVKISKLKNARYQKCYVCLFVCMVSRSVHLEFVLSLTTEACLAALDRFIGRRGLPSDLYSDQGSNFRGAAREISELSKFFEDADPAMSHYLATHGISWHHNPPYAPSMGGLWEAGVKSFKHHLKRIMGGARMHIEQFMTITTRIEAILNSRPFCNQSSSPDDDLDPLTPGHFLIGGALLSRHEVDLTKIPTNRLTQWQLSQQIVQSFWKRWSNDYIQSLQKRPKWTNPPKEIKEGDLVLWYSPNAPPTHWPVGRVLNLISGADGIARVVRLKTATGEMIRPLNKVAILPPP